MFTLEKEFTFEAAHQLPHHDGKCARLHGHSWKGLVRVQGHALQTSGAKAGMLIDFGTVKAAVSDLVEKHLDHYFLNESTGLENPTSEELARWVFVRVAMKLHGDLAVPHHRTWLQAVVIEETCTSRCIYEPSAPEVDTLLQGIVIPEKKESAP